MRDRVRGAGDAGASAWARYRVLAAEYRRERVAVRGLVAVSAGVVAAGVLPWRAGPVVAIVVFVGHTLYERSRHEPLAEWRRGALAERRTGRRLRRLDPVGHHVLHDRALPGATANLDHLVVGLTGVYAIVSRRWRWGVRVRVEGRRLWVGRRPAGNVAVAARAARTVSEGLSKELDHQVAVMPLVAVHGARVPRGGLEHAGVALYAVREVAAVIAGEPVIFTSAQVATVAAAAERLFPPMAGPYPAR
ncbi:hypothetical protein GCM10009678_02720 [Actinomadura kijaniata]|uniref:NERD domain-containing protein n=1 Tax=Actinomadura namibiensis TaxID=182080 RepID=A0A7W3LTW0_ACTNM|nr:NERD domain-containing protein [Actinomadura namibiensis]MBA8954157.1 hypothetical protein [Actinomadura namibiensis]